MSVVGIFRAAVAFIILTAAGCAAFTGQLLSYIFVRPFSRLVHRRICAVCAGAFLLCGSGLLERWACKRIQCHGEPSPQALSTLCTLNHGSDIDMLIGSALLARYGFPAPGNAKAVVKNSLLYVPIFGWILAFAEYLFVTRDWKTDRARLQKRLRHLQSFPFPLWFILFPEGSRLTPQKLLHSQNYAQNSGFPQLNHVLLPRFKAFLALVASIRPSVEEICDVTIVFDGPVPTLMSILSAESTT